MNVLSTNVNPLIRFVFYALIIALPFENAIAETVSIVGSIPMIIGMALTGAALLQPRICFNPPPGAFWCFAGYVLVYLILGATPEGAFEVRMIVQLLTLIQMLALMWISYNLLKDPEICKGVFLALGISCTIISVLHIFGVGAVNAGQGRSSTFGDNANTAGATLSMGLIALVGITCGRINVEKWIALLAWTCVPVIGIALVMTGSRGAMIALVLGLAMLIIKKGTRGTKLGVGLVTVLVITFLVWATYTNEAMRTRWEHSLFEGDVAKRDEIIPRAWAMFLEKPLLGWGPVSFRVELGSREGLPERDTHNVYLWVLTETGLLGAIPFFAGLWLSLRAAWRARSGSEGALPMAMLVCLLIINMGITWHNRKIFWLTMAYVLASAWYVRKVSQHPPVRFTDPLNSRGSGTFPPCSQAAEGLTGSTSARQRERQADGRAVLKTSQSRGDN